jgi:hypothetical protein
MASNRYRNSDSDDDSSTSILSQDAVRQLLKSCRWKNIAQFCSRLLARGPALIAWVMLWRFFPIFEVKFAFLIAFLMWSDSKCS